MARRKGLKASHCTIHILTLRVTAVRLLLGYVQRWDVSEDGSQDEPKRFGECVKKKQQQDAE